MNNLRPNITSTAQAVEMGRKGGLASTPQKRLSAKLRELKKKGLTDSNSRELYETLTSPELSALELKIALQQIRSLAKPGDKPGSALTTSQKLEAWNKMLDLHKAVHGTKIELKAETYSENVNIDLQLAASHDDIAALFNRPGDDSRTLER